MKRPNATEAEVLKEFPDAKIINSFANGCLKATNEINNKLMNAGIKIGNYDGSLSITKQGSKYKLIGAIKEQDLHEQGAVQGFDTYQEAADAIKKYGYKIRNSGPIKIGDRVIVNAGYHKNEPATVINMGEGANNYRVQFDNGAVAIVSAIDVKAMNKIGNAVVLKKLIKHLPEKETGYDKKMDMEYWTYEWSDGKKGEGSLHKSQMEGLPKG
jgi:hypothetical protein